MSGGKASRKRLWYIEIINLGGRSWYTLYRGGVGMLCKDNLKNMREMRIPCNVNCCLYMPLFTLAWEFSLKKWTYVKISLLTLISSMPHLLILGVFNERQKFNLNALTYSILIKLGFCRDSMSKSECLILVY